MSGGNGKSAEEVERMQDAYVDARIAGKNGEQAKAIAGYSPANSVTRIEKEGGPVRNKIIAKLAEKGIDEEHLADQYVKGLSLATRSGAKDLDLNAHAQYLKQIGFLLGYAKSGPSVAVQINNHTGNPEKFDNGAVVELVRLIREELESRGAGGLHAGNPGDADTTSHPGVDQPSSETRPPSSGGGA